MEVTPLKHNNCNCGLTPSCENAERFVGCNMPIRRHLEPVLVARIYNQPIVEELPYSAMSMTVDNTATISNIYADKRPPCGECSCNDGLNYQGY